MRGRVGLLGHEPLLYRDLTGAREPALSMRSLHGAGRCNVWTSCCERWRCGPRATSPLKSLSRGMVQRVAVAARPARPRAAAARRAVLESRSRRGRARRPADRRGVGAHTGDLQPRPGRRARAGRSGAGSARRAHGAAARRHETWARQRSRSCTGETDRRCRSCARTCSWSCARSSRSPAMSLFSVTTFVIFHFALDQTSARRRRSRPASCG